MSSSDDQPLPKSSPWRKSLTRIADALLPRRLTMSMRRRYWEYLARKRDEITSDPDLQSNQDSEPISIVRLEPMIRALSPAYFSEGVTAGRFNARVHIVHHTPCDGRTYVIFAESYVFYSFDGFITLHEVKELNYHNGTLVAAGTQFVDAAADTTRGTVLLIGRDSHDGARNGVVWRKEAGAQTFVRNVALTESWPMNKAGNVAAGFFGVGGAQMIEMVVAAPYAPGAHIFYSIDDGVTWHRHDLTDVFADHVHQVWLPRSATPGRIARLWITGGDDPSGQKSGVICYESLTAAGALGGFRWVLHERPGYRLVAITGNGKHVYVGNESLSGGVLKIHDNAESIAAHDFEYVLGKSRHDYHQFRSMIATLDGTLISATDNYSAISDTVRADSGGYIYISRDEGATFREIALGTKWITSLTDDGTAFWASMSMNREDGIDVSSERLSLLRIPRPSPYATLTEPYCAKAVVMDSSSFYKMAGYAAHPRARLEPGETTFRVDMGKYRTVTVSVGTYGAATLIVEALPFYNWTLEENSWSEVGRIECSHASSTQVLITEAGAHNRHFRLRNAAEAVDIRGVVFVGKS